MTAIGAGALAITWRRIPRSLASSVVAMSARSRARRSPVTSVTVSQSPVTSPARITGWYAQSKVRSAPSSPTALSTSTPTTDSPSSSTLRQMPATCPSSSGSTSVIGRPRCSSTGLPLIAARARFTRMKRRSASSSARPKSA